MMIDALLPQMVEIDLGERIRPFISSPQEVDPAQVYFEGAVTQVTVNAYERNERARRRCIAHYGLRCRVCETNFEEVYGHIGAGFIHVHHLKPLSEIRAEYVLDPIEDLRPVCPNCHAMIHRRRPPYTIEEVKEMLFRRRENR
jgi:predicted HNH restriction endonuclease